ncbi:odorant receptor Or1 [Papilio machaon]|uniref:odorant receptor Or1 n=1 Tax=Papilio machaon TaxID=76193 RepID=UPI001E664ED2|nr:odorant receptor Or1 [Papilio machaon]
MAVNSIDLFLSRPKRVLKALGIWLTPERPMFLHSFYTAFIMLTQYAFIIFEFVYIAGVWGDLEAMSEASYLLFTQASVCYKVTVFLLNKNNIKVLIEYMEMDIFTPETEEQQKIMVKLSSQIKKLCMFFLTSALTTCTLWALMPLLDDTGGRFFPFRIWMPFGPEKSPQFEIGYVYQMGSIYISAFLFFAVDSITLGMIMFGCAQLDIIIDKVQKMQSVSLSSKLTDEQRTMRISNNNKLFVECIDQHQTVIRFIEIVEDTYHANIFFQLSGTVAIICIIGLRITMSEPSSIQFYSMLNYMVTMLSQLLLYCWCGSELTTRSQELRDSLYQSPWYEQDRKFKKLLFITMECMKKPIVFKAGHYIPLSRPTFVSILRSSYSFFAVLNQTHN